MTPIEFEALSKEKQETVRELASEKGKRVYYLDYDTGAPGGGGYASVRRYRGMYFISSLDDRPPGPFASLRDAILEGCLAEITSAVGSVDCAGMKTNELLVLFTVHEPPVTILLNDEVWTYDPKSGWQRDPDYVEDE